MVGGTSLTSCKMQDRQTISFFKFDPAVWNDGKRGMRRGRLTTGRPPRHCVAGRSEGNPAYGVRLCAPEARFIFLSTSSQSLPSCLSRTA